MNSSVALKDGFVKTMSSKQIADVVNSRHDSVKRTIERLAEKGVISQPPLVDGEKSANGVVEKLYICVNQRVVLPRLFNVKRSPLNGAYTLLLI